MHCPLGIVVNNGSGMVGMLCLLLQYHGFGPYLSTSLPRWYHKTQQALWIDD